MAYLRLLFLLLPPLAAGCTGTPVPIPIPVEAKALRLSTPSPDGQLLLAGLAGAVALGDQVTIANLTQSGQSWRAPTASVGSFAALLAARAGDQLELRAVNAGSEGPPLQVLVGAGNGRPAPLLQVSSPDKGGEVTLNGDAVNALLLLAPRTGQVVSVSIDAAGHFTARLQAELGDQLGAFGVDASSAGGAYRALRVEAGDAGDCLDADRDGYGRAGSLPLVCSGIPALADCSDAVAEAHPGQTRFFDTAVPAQAGGFDYNCDGQEERQLTAVLDCASASGKTCSGEGWRGALAACGQSGAWVSCSWDGNSCLEQNLGSRVQSCR